MSSAPVLVLNAKTKRESGRKTQLGNIQAAKMVADVIRTSLGPKAMHKMILSMSGGIVITNDGNVILRELDVNHPSAKAVMDLSRAQDEEVGDGTTSVVVLAGELLSLVEPWLVKGLSPNVIIRGLKLALQDALAHLKSIAIPVNRKSRQDLLDIVKSCIGTKFAVSFYPSFLSELALDAVMLIAQDGEEKDIDIKRYVRIEKIPGGRVDDCCIVLGVVLNKDVTHVQMRRRIENPRVVILDCNLEYKKGENQVTLEVTKTDQWAQIMQQEEDYVKKMVEDIARMKPDLVCTEKGISDLAQHYLVKHNISALRRLKKTDAQRLARACGATIVSRPDNLKESDVGVGATLFEIKKIGDEYYSFITCSKSKACTILLRGPGKDMLNEVERNVQDALAVARNIIQEPLLVYGGGAAEMSVASKLTEKSKTIPGVVQFPYATVSFALEIIPHTLIQNCGTNVVRNLTALRAKHAVGEGHYWGIDGQTGLVRDVRELRLYEPYSVKAQTLKTSIEAACMLLRIDQILSGISKKNPPGQPPSQTPQDSAEDSAAMME